MPFSVPGFDRNFEGVKDGVFTLNEEEAEFEGDAFEDLAAGLRKEGLESAGASLRCFLARSWLNEHPLFSYLQYPWIWILRHGMFLAHSNFCGARLLIFSIVLLVVCLRDLAASDFVPCSLLA